MVLNICYTYSSDELSGRGRDEAIATGTILMTGVTHDWAFSWDVTEINIQHFESKNIYNSHISSRDGLF